VAAGESEILKKLSRLLLRSKPARAKLRAMNVILKYRGRAVTDAEVAFIQELIAAHPTLSRWRLSLELCRAWNWVQPNGCPRDMVCRGLMLALHRAGQIVLPERRRAPANPLAQRSPPAVVQIDRRPLQGSLQTLLPLRVEQVRRTPQEGLFNSLIEQHHYLGYTQPVGEHLKYLVFVQERPIACLAWSSAPRHLGPRDRFLGWSAEARRKNLHLIASNLRFLVLPWVQVPHLASHLLGRMARQLPGDWERVYGHGLYFLETFVDPERFRGTCYRAANWIALGRTTGRGKDDQTHRANRSLKEVWGYPLHRHFRRRLSVV
jgi:hypothetical protein